MRGNLPGGNSSVGNLPGGNFPGGNLLGGNSPCTDILIERIIIKEKACIREIN